MKLLKRSILVAVTAMLGVVMFAGCKSNNGREEKEPSENTRVLDTAKIEAELRKDYALSPDDPKKGPALRAVLKDAMGMGYNDQVCNVLMEFGRRYADQGKFDSSLYYYQMARKYCFKPLYDKTLPAAYLAEFGAFYHSMRSDNVAANNSYYEALQYLKANNLTEQPITIGLYIYLFGTQEKLGHPEQALSYLKEAERLAIKLKSEMALIVVRTNFGNYYSERKDYKTARTYYDMALDSVQTWNPYWDPNALIAALVGKASVRVKTGEAADAVPILKKAIQVAKENSIVYSEVAATIDLGEAYNKLGRFRETVDLVTGVLQQQNSGFNWYREEGYRVLMDAYEGLGQYKQALEYQRKLHSFEDSLTNVEKTVALSQLELKYQTVNKDKEIAAKRLVIEQQRNKLSRNRILLAGISAVAVLALIVVFMLFKNSRQRQTLQNAEIRTLKRQQEINLLKSTMQGEEQERKRLSRELHDGIGSMVFSAIMSLSLLKKKDPKSVTQKDFDDVLHLLEQTGREVRKTAQNMMPDILSKQSLFEAIQTYCQTISQGSPVNIDVQLYGGDDNFTPDVKLVIYRVVQELVHNVMKHAHATHAIVQGVLNEDNFTITVEDNGIGFDPTIPRKGMGLKNLEARVRSLYGEFQIESSPGNGTTIYMEFDYHRLNQEAPSAEVK
jgi:two-component system, NarL family, sensor kinase